VSMYVIVLEMYVVVYVLNLSILCKIVHICDNVNKCKKILYHFVSWFYVTGVVTKPNVIFRNKY
jgi:hypothetical protein